MRRPLALNRVLLSLLSLGLVGWLAPGDAQARTRDTLDGTTNNFATTQTCRGHKILATVDTIVEDFDVYLQNSFGKDVDWYVYESATSNGTYAQIAHNRTTGTSSGTYAWNNSGPLFGNVSEGEYYVLAACWNASSAITINHSTSTLPDSPSWGTWQTASFLNASPPGPSTTWSSSTARPNMRINSSAGSSVSASGVVGSLNFSHTIVRGNSYEVTKDTRLTDVRQYLQVTASTGGTFNFGTYSVPWSIYRRAGTCSSNTSFDQVLTYSGFGIGGSGATFNVWAAWNPNIVMEGGYCYFIGIDHNFGGTGPQRTYYEQVSNHEARWGTNRGYSWISQSGSPGATETVGMSPAYSVVQRVGAVRDVESSEAAAGTFSTGATAEFGNIFEVSTPTHISEMAVQIDPNYAGTVSLAVYESPTQNGSYNRIWSGEVEHDDVGKSWLVSQELDLDLDPSSMGGTGYYLFVAESNGAVVLSRDLVANGVADFGDRVGAHWANTSTAGLPQTLNVGFQGRFYDWRIVSCDGCVDIDGDGYELTEDCDDGDGTVNPGMAEVCNGIDDNCDGSLLTGGESDSDGDGQRSCAGDCDDGNSDTYTGASEICDGEDNDCNSTTPTNETDGDGDGFVTCAFAVSPAGTNFIGGGDCNDSDPNVSPGLAFETCDGQDDNCDSQAWIASTAELGTFFNDSNGGLFAGNIYSVLNTTTMQGLQMRMIVPVPESMVFGLFQGPTINGPWTEIESVSTGVAGTLGGPGWVGPLPGTFNSPLIAGQYYVAGAWWAGAAQYNANFGGGGPTFPHPTSFGEQVGALGDGSASFPSGSLPSGMTTLTNISLAMRVYTDSEQDGDGDSYLQCNDCVDTDATIFPSAPELCDGLDNDCDGALPSSEGDSDNDGSLNCDDCDDANANSYPGATEICDGLDNDCNGQVPSSGALSEQDLDNDSQRVCGGDCDDGDALIGLGFTEICDGNDSDCDGVTNPVEVDNDGDNFIDCVLSAGANPPAGVSGGDDCDDTANDVYPGAPELCDGSTIDNNCNGTASDEGADVDGDGTNTCTDCDDTDANVFPGAAEICDGKNSDCASGVPADEQDPDGDGYIACTLTSGANPPAFVTGGDDCLATNDDFYPGAPELCDGQDNNCDLVVPIVELDSDNDGLSTCAGDCDDSDPTTYPGASEICDGVDNDCNNSTPANEADSDTDGQRICGGDCNDGNAAIYTGNSEICDGLNNDCAGGVDDGFDGDTDGFFDGNNSGCVAAYAQVDCNDAVSSIYPGAAEVCDAVDQDCDNTVDEGFDGDSDTYFDGANSGCVAAYGSAAVDCDDGAASINPGATEICDGIDQDCDGAADNGFDGDGDSFFDGANAGCLAQYGAAADCDDTVASINPGASEVCNAVDDDCNGVIDNGFDLDGDGYFDQDNAACLSTYTGALTDCDDSEALTYPGAPEVCDGADNDCDSLVDEDFDVDGDTYFDTSCSGGDDCDDTNAAVNPAATETCDGTDENCNGAADETFDADVDGYYDAADPLCLATWTVLADCDDSDPSINPFAIEMCDGIDQNCDTVADEAFDTDGDLHYDDGVPDCVLTYAASDLDCDDSVATTYAGAAEICNAVDDDCDSPAVVDEGFDTDGDGFYDGSNAGCVAAYASVDCNDAVATIFPGAAEVCDGVDQDCDGVVPAIEIDNDGDGFNECADGDCDDTNNAVFAGGVEICNGVDDNCDTNTDEPFDLDGDTYFVNSAACTAAYGAANVDCNDAAPAINPGATEACNGIDDNCAGGIDETFDVDADTYFTDSAACISQYGAGNVDCDDAAAAVNPGQSEDCTNGIDDDCDGSADVGFDVDGDGADTCNGDCNDTNPAINPSATELCDAIDNNCNQQVDEGFDVDADTFTSCGGDCDDTAAAINPLASELCDAIDNDCDTDIDEDFDLDSDGAFDAAAAGCTSAYSAVNLDCNDANANINPAASEVCDLVDNDCDVLVDEDFDADGDGAFDGANTNCVNTYGAAVDCDDGDNTFFPGAPELCDGLDNDCDSVIPPDEIDDDVDGYTECEPPGAPGTGGDCDDAVASINPGAAEICNLIDDDCDGMVDEDFDADGDGAPDENNAACQLFYSPEDLDCDDADDLIFPYQAELCDLLDNDCDGDYDEDFDADGDGSFDGDEPDCVTNYASTDCDDADGLVFPGQVEDCSNLIDDNCNGLIDEDTDADGDGVATCAGDCEDTDASIYPGAPEICDGLDQNCDFIADETFDVDGDGFLDEVACTGFYPVEILDCDDALASVNPDAIEECNAVDDDCDGAIDENFDLDEDTFFDRLDVGCIQTYGALNTDCDDLDAVLNPDATEVCNAIDDDCDGIVDEGFDMDADGVWAEDAGCAATYGGPGDCDDSTALVHPEYDDGQGTVIPAADALCDGLDNDCDGVISEDMDVDGYLDADNLDCSGDDLDCDDAEATVNPGEDEICDDTIDNDCDADIDLDDADCDEPSDDDDSAGDDDDDDDGANEPDPDFDPEFEGDGVTLLGGCDSCLGSVGGPDAGGLGLGIAMVLGFFGLRRRRRQSGGLPRGAVMLLAAGLSLSALTVPSVALAQMEQEAERQLDLAWKDLEAEQWEKAVNSAESALRLNPSLYTAMVVKALAYEGQGQFRKAESWLQTYLELTRSLSQAPQAMDLAGRLKERMGNSAQVKAETTATVAVKRSAFGDGSVVIGGLLGARMYSQSPCGAGEGCEDGVETRPGFWATNSSGFGGGLSVRGEYFFGGWLVGLRVRYDLGAGEPINAYGVDSHSKPGHRLDANVVFRPQLVSGLTSLRLLADVGYGMRTWTAYETVSKDTSGASTAAAMPVVAHQFGGGIGVRVEPGQVLGIDFRYGVAGLIGGGGGINDHSIEVGVGIRPVAPLLIRAGFDMHMGSLYVGSSRDGATQRAALSTLRAGLFVGAGVVF